MPVSWIKTLPAIGSFPYPTSNSEGIKSLVIEVPIPNLKISFFQKS